MKKQLFRLSLAALLIAALLLPLCLSSCKAKEPVTDNRITSVALNKKGEIEVEVALTEQTRSEIGRGKIYLFELDSTQGVGVSLPSLEPVAEAKPKEHVTFKLSLADGTRSRLYSSFLVASYDAEKRAYTKLTNAMALSNPEASADRAPAKDTEISIKGLAAVDGRENDAVRLGIAHAVVDVDMDKLILDGWEKGAVPYLWNGTTAYLNGDVLNALEEEVTRYTLAGVNVYLRFLTEDTGRMSSRESGAVTEGFFDFMADLYADPAEWHRPVTRFIIGYRANDPSDLATAQKSAYLASYEKLLRVAHTAIKSHNPDGRAYASVDHRQAAADGAGWSVPAFLSALRDECARRGDYDWGVAGELYAANSTVWKENPTTDRNHYTVSSLSALTDLLATDKYRAPNGELRRLMIQSFSIPAVRDDDHEGQKEKAASIAYAYMACVQNGCVEALIYDAGTSWNSAAYATFGTMDTSAADLSAALTATVGDPYVRLESALAGKNPPVTKVTGKSSLLSLEREHKKTAPLFTFDGGSLHGMTDGGNLTYVELAADNTFGGILHAQFDRQNVNDPMGLSVRLPASDLIGGEKLYMDFCAPDGATVTLRLTRLSKGAVADGDGTVIYESKVSGVTAGKWQTALFEVQDFTDKLDASDEVILTLLTDNAKGTTHELDVAGLHITGTGASASQIWLIVGVVVLAILLVAGVVVLLFLRNKRRREGA